MSASAFVDTPGPQLWSDGDPTSQSTGTVTVGTYIIYAELYGWFNLARLRFRFGGTAGNGNWDVGLYNALGQLIVSQGLILTVAGTQDFVLPNALWLPKGHYYKGFVVTSALDQITKSNGNTNNVAVQMSSSVTALPPNLSSLVLADVATRPIVLGVPVSGFF